jgi:hypothetical protein
MSAFIAVDIGPGPKEKDEAYGEERLGMSEAGSYHVSQ